MQHLRSRLMNGENSTELQKWPDKPKELNDSVWEETLNAIFEHWDKYWEGLVLLLLILLVWLILE